MSAWTKIAHTEVGSGGAANITFSSIPQTYTDLILVHSVRPPNTDIDEIQIVFNNNTSDYIGRWLEGNGASASSGDTLPFYIGAYQGTTSDTFSNGCVYIPNYTSSSNKSFSADGVSEANQTTAYQLIKAGLWDNSSAITEIRIGLYLNDLAQYSSATLYGITKGSSGGVSVS